MAYFSIRMALHAEGSYEDVLGLMTDGLAWSAGEEPPVLPSKSAICQARVRLGPEPIAALFSAVAAPLAQARTPSAFLGGRRLVAVDGTCLDVADTPENDAYFGRPGVNKGERAAFPQARVVAVAECGTHAIFDAAVGTYDTSENTLAADLPGMLVLADRGICGFPLWSKGQATGTDLLWRAKSIRRWWNTLGRVRFPGSSRLLITADAEGSNGYRVRAFKWHLAHLAAETGLEITVCDYPPGTSKWNRIEHRLGVMA